MRRLGYCIAIAAFFLLTILAVIAALVFSTSTLFAIAHVDQGPQGKAEWHKAQGWTMDALLSLVEGASAPDALDTPAKLKRKHVKTHGCGPGASHRHSLVHPP